MRRLALVVLLLAAGCGGRAETSPEDVVRAWSRAINANRNGDAADLFARDARVVQVRALVLHTHADALAWNASLPCAGRIEEIEVDGDEVSAVFRLGERPRHACDGPGERAAAVFRIRDGKIVLWHQTPAPPETGVV